VDDGYKVGLIGTEPYSLLAGADDMVIPQVLPTWASAQSIYGAIRKLDKDKDLDVIIVGSQTGLSAPVIDSQGRAGAIGSAVITLGSQPDFLVMACSYDKLQELPTAIKLNELLTSKKVICVTFNRYNLSDDETLKSLEWIEKETGLPACDVLTQEDKLKNVVISYLKS
jgi:uncharacterized NAD-dependent epimerase/dehydratase family protein